MPSNTAAWIPASKVHPFEVKEAPYPEVFPDTVIIKAGAVAMNPVDYMIQTSDMMHTKYPAVLGEDVAGEIVEGGEGRFKKGDRVLAHGGPFIGDKATGTFQAYVRAPIASTAKIPSSMKYEEAVVLPLCFSTASAALFHESKLALPLPTLSTSDSQGEGESKGVLFVWGGSSAVGSNAIQLGKASGHEVITTVSTSNFSYVKTLGVSQAFDRSDSDVAEKIISYLKGKKLVGIYDTIQKPETMGACRDIANSTDLKKVIGVKLIQEKDATKDGVTYDVAWATVTQTTGLGNKVYQDFLEPALEKGSYQCMPKGKVVGTGLGDIQAGLDELKKGVSATKIVVTL